MRELFAVVESATIRAGDRRIEAQHLPPELRVAVAQRGDHQRYHAGAGDAPGERAAIAAALKQTGGGLAQAASLWGMGRTTLWRKLKAYGIETREQHGAGDE